MRRLLLVSSSTTHGTEYLDHCAAQAQALFERCRRLLFVPWAVHDHAAYAAAVRDRFVKLKLEVDSIHAAPNAAAAIEQAEAVFIGGGNTFRLLDSLYRHRALDPIRQRVARGMPYMGTSAGSNVACPTIRTTNDMPIVQPPSFDALGLVPFQINAHYLDPDPQSTHRGETRDMRLREYLEENDLDVVALREGAMIAVTGDAATLQGTRGARLFRRGAEPREYDPGADLGFLLARGGP